MGINFEITDEELSKKLYEIMIAYNIIGVKDFTCVPDDLNQSEKPFNFVLSAPEFVVVNNDRYGYQDILDSLKADLSKLLTYGDIKDLNRIVDLHYTIRQGEIFEIKGFSRMKEVANKG